jgi:hypothetical protein
VPGAKNISRSIDLVVLFDAYASAAWLITATRR